MAIVDAPVPPGPQTVNIGAAHNGAGRSPRSVGNSVPRPTGRQCADRTSISSFRSKSSERSAAAPISVADTDGPGRLRTIRTGVAASVATSTRSRSKLGVEASTSSAEYRRPEPRRTRTSSAETHLTNSAAMAADVDHWASASNHRARAGARPRRTNRSSATSRGSGAAAVGGLGLDQGDHTRVRGPDERLDLRQVADPESHEGGFAAPDRAPA